MFVSAFRFRVLGGLVRIGVFGGLVSGVRVGFCRILIRGAGLICRLAALVFIVRLFVHVLVICFRKLSSPHSSKQTTTSPYTPKYPFSDS